MPLHIRDYEADRQKIYAFLENFKSDTTGTLKYIEEVKRLAVRNKRSIVISVDDVDSVDADLAHCIVTNTPRYVSLFAKVVSDLIDLHRDAVLEENEIPAGRKDALDVYIETCEMLSARKYAETLRIENAAGGFKKPPEPKSSVPDELKFRFDVYFHPPSYAKRLSARDVKSNCIGHLIWVRAMVTRVSDVKPMLSVATYTCERCGVETYQQIRSPSFMPITSCPSKECVINRTANTMTLQAKGSKFLKFQEIRVQELSEQVPVGGIPRSLVVWCVGENTRQCQPGDYVDITGVFMPIQKQTPYKRMMQGLLTDVALVAHEVKLINKSDDNVSTALTGEEIAELRNRCGGNVYETLAANIAPEIYGHEDIKKALVLMLVGGVEKSSKGMKIRGDIHICLMGDPGVAKSQLLSYVTRLAQRSQYTTGRGSSGVGLTAAVLKDPTTNEMVLEGGSLVLADGGICCIDEFDKMSETDRTAIHEVMEQQTISVAKAGIITNLNARVSILAAANPAYGRYNIYKTVAQNVQLPAALLSRFDILWVMQDKPNNDADFRLAKHIVHVHRHEKEPQCKKNTPGVIDAVKLDMDTIRRYLNVCKRLHPTLSADILNFAVSAYVQMRADARIEQNKKIKGYTSARTFLSLMRLSSAHARVRLSERVEREDLVEAIRLMDMSKQSLITGQEEIPGKLNELDQVFGVLREMVAEMADSKTTDESRKTTRVNRNCRTIKYSDALERCLNRGFTKEQFQKCISEHTRLDVIQMVKGGERINFV